MLLDHFELVIRSHGPSPTRTTRGAWQVQPTRRATRAQSNVRTCARAEVQSRSAVSLLSAARDDERDIDA
jgi:hypothetical protein